MTATAPEGPELCLPCRAAFSARTVASRIEDLAAEPNLREAAGDTIVTHEVAAPHAIKKIKIPDL